MDIGGIIKAATGGTILLLLGVCFFLWKDNKAQAELNGHLTAVNAGLQAANETLVSDRARVDEILRGWSNDRQTLAATRETVRRAVKDAMESSVFADWYRTALPAAALPGGGLLHSGGDGNSNGEATASSSIAGTNPESSVER